MKSGDLVRMCPRDRASYAMLYEEFPSRRDVGQVWKGELCLVLETREHGDSTEFVRVFNGSVTGWGLARWFEAV